MGDGPSGKIGFVTGSEAERQCLEGLIRRHLDLHPGFGPPDLGKLLYQGVLGMDHLLADRGRFLAGLAQEWDDLDPEASVDEPLLESVHPTGRVARLNLRPAKRAGLSLAALGPALADQPPKNGDWEEFWALWAAVIRLSQAGRLPFSGDELVRVGEEIKAERGSPGHSPRYRKANRPAYRLIHDIADPRWSFGVGVEGDLTRGLSRTHGTSP